MLKQGSTIGILGGGQLGRMIAMSCMELGYRSHVFTPPGDNPAAEIASEITIANWEDNDAIEKFAKSVDVVTLEFENIPLNLIKKLEKIIKVYPNSEVLEISQYRPLEKKTALSSGIEVPRWWLINSKSDLKKSMDELNGEGIFKTTRMGYDGKGQFQISGKESIDELWGEISNSEVILEEKVDFKSEISFLICRNESGETSIFPPTENIHKGGILNKSIIPADLSEEVWFYGAAKVLSFATDLKLKGLLAVELFHLNDGRLLFNEMAPRPHNSFHWTMDGLICSQFNQLVRCVSGLPFGNVSCKGQYEMINILSENYHELPKYYSDPESKVYLYNKTGKKTFRKLGHINKILNN